VLPVLCSSVPLVTDGKVTGAVITFRDITEQKTAEKALRESETQFRSAVLDASLPIAIHAEDGEILQISKVWTELTGYAHGDIPTVADWAAKAYGRRGEEAGDISRSHDLRDMGEGEFIITTNGGVSRVWDFSSASLGKLPDGRRLVVSMATDITERKRAEGALHHLADRLTTAQEDERRRISRALHDDAGQALSAIGVRLHMLERRLSAMSIDPAVCREISELQDIARTTQQSLRRMAHSLHPSVLEHFGLAEAVRGFLNEFCAHGDLECSVDVPRGFPRLPAAVESAIYRIVQEVAANTLKHARARTVWLRMVASGDKALIVFQDDGCGFDPDGVEARGGIGLVSMRERAEMIGAELKVASQSGRGTLVTLCVPLRDRAI
ncbi:MAG: PAS domain-containing sensor histidine kinase, partial [Pyrinomonadaceae bacterium]